MSVGNLEIYKEKFLQKFNPEKSLVVAKNKALNAAVQHNKFYENVSLSIDEKNGIRKFWFDELDKFREVYGFNNPPEIFIDHVIEFRDNCLSKNKDIVFLISHAQKSLSVYAKHLWCMNLISQPEICPVDRMILSKTNCPIEKRSWTKVNTKKNYLEHINYIKEMASANGQTIAEWELRNF
jgi:hypothetical protein